MDDHNFGYSRRSRARAPGLLPVPQPVPASAAGGPAPADGGPRTPVHGLDSPFDESRLLSFLQSANFSTDSLGSASWAPPDPEAQGLGIQSPSTRRYSAHSLNNSPVLQARRAAPSARPKSAIFLDSINFAISEDGSPVQDAINNTPRARNSYHFGGARASLAAQAYVPVPSIAPPTGPAHPAHAAAAPRLGSPRTSPARSALPSRYGRLVLPIRKRNALPERYQPFNFQPEVLNQSASALKPAHRKGHKYKHSSVLMNLFQEPPPALQNLHTLQPLAIPDLFPVPTLREVMALISGSQRAKLVWLAAHVVLLGVVFVVGARVAMPLLLTLAHLVFYDALALVVVVFVEIMSNFEVWGSSSIQYPFGLGRLEVLVGFALSTLLVMVGVDLISHLVEEFVIGMAFHDASGEVEHLSHHIHGSPGAAAPLHWGYELVLAVTVAMTLVLSNYILVHDRIRRMIALAQEAQALTARREWAPVAFMRRYYDTVSRYPTHLLTLLYAVFLMAAPVLPVGNDVDVNEATTLVVASLLCYNGLQLAKSLGGILLLSYPHLDYRYFVLKLRILDRVEQLDCFKLTWMVDRLFVAKFNYELYVVGLRIVMRGGSSEMESEVRFEVGRVVRDCVGLREGKIEITIDIDRN